MIDRSIESYIDTHLEESLKQLEKIVNIESYTHDIKGVNKVNNALEDWLNKLGFKTTKIFNKEYGNHLLAQISGENKNGKILLMGHMDTAHPTGTLKEFPFNNDNKFLHGPGVSDMKSGIISMILAAKAIQQTNVDAISEIEILLTPDEEVGSPISKNIIPRYAKEAKAVFNLEPGRPDGSVVNKRKGSAHLKINIEGKAAHSGTFYEDGISANDELALKMIEIKKLEKEADGLTINFGLIEGGTSNNIVSPHSSATIHLSFWTVDDYNYAFEKINEIVEHSYIDGTQAKLVGSIGILPMIENEGVKKLMTIYSDTAASLGQDIQFKPTKGASDAGFVSNEGIPIICGVGPVGGKWHTTGEYMELNSFYERTNVLAHTILNTFKSLS